MELHNPEHPGEVIREVYLEPNGIPGRQSSDKLGVSASTLARILNGSNGVSSEMALRLSNVLGRSAESWMIMQDHFDLWQARQRVNLYQVQSPDLQRADQRFDARKFMLESLKNHPSMESLTSCSLGAP
jgi:addiction module HigA family antidote